MAHKRLTKILAEINKDFFTKLKEKPEWSAREVKIAYRKSVTKALISLLDNGDFVFNPGSSRLD